MEHLSSAFAGGMMKGPIEGLDRTSRRRAGRLAAWIAAVGLACASAPALVAGAADESAAPAASKAASGAAQSTWAYDLAGELMSPFCPGRTLASCPSPQAGELIQWIATQEAAGVSRDEVIAILVARHGEEILGAPPAKGITLWAYVFPVLGFVAFGGVAAVVLRRVVAAKDGGAASAPGASSPASGPSAAASTSAPRADPRTSATDELARIVDAELADRA